MIPLDEIPEHVIYALITREDQNFYHHPGFDFLRLLKATWGYLTGNFQGGGSTLTIQVAGRKYADRSEITIQRKLVELWYALLLEKKFPKS